MPHEIPLTNFRGIVGITDFCSLYPGSKLSTNAIHLVVIYVLGFLCSEYEPNDFMNFTDESFYILLNTYNATRLSY